MVTLKPMRRSGSALVAGIAVLTLLLSACAGDSGSNGDDDSAPGDAPESSLLPPTEGKVDYPLTLETSRGEITIEERPERIATVNPTAQDTELLLALGVAPVMSSGVAETQGRPYLEDHGLDDIEEFFEFDFGESLPVEEIAASKPDLIVATQWADGNGGASLGDYYDQLSAIAPVVVEEEPLQGLAPWQESIPILGKALDLQDGAAQAVEAAEQSFAALRDEHPEFSDLTTSFAMVYTGEAGLQYISSPDTNAEKLLTEDLGFAPNPLAEEHFAGKTGTELRVSNENLSQIDADVLILGIMNEDLFTDLQENRLFKNLEAVKSDQMISFSTTDEAGNLPWAITTGGPLGQLWAAEQLVSMITDETGF